MPVLERRGNIDEDEKSQDIRKWGSKLHAEETKLDEALDEILGSRHMAK